ncbi:DUF3291 domain-containing protein [Endozoicomonas arenosclerae]|uniref:DUF3291 domain-containing protein n=1 Tax=Endozoicomonas arenosclerae TaxID=1633495 RepID=UPI000785925A|nr:DUF3291 domain-containing protein [Endozoicomonas arenosclerae]
MDQFHLAQVNIARTKASLESPVMKGFVDQLDRVNQLAEQSDGFVWRLQSEEGDDATSIQAFEDENIIINMSVWRDIESLKNFVYSGEHLALLKNKKLWFEKMSIPTQALWWLPVEQLPGVEDAIKVLKQLEEEGSTEKVFTFNTARAIPETVQT